MLSAKLYICATPIGNLEDVSFRLLKTLKEVEYIVAEDTRTLRKILTRYNISKSKDSIISYQDYSSEAKIEYICNKILGGKNVALVSESGVPSIQDPGFKLVSLCIKKGIQVTVIPGPNAALSALVMSGLPTDSFLFVGFLPKSKSKRKKKIFELKYLPYTLIFYESPLRIEKLLNEFLEEYGERKACIVREISKVYEETIRGTIPEIIEIIKGKKLKGELVFLVEGYNRCNKKNNKKCDESCKVLDDNMINEIRKEFKSLLKQNFLKKEAIKILKSRYNISRNKLYDILTKIRE